MSYRNLTEDEKESFDLIIEDLHFLFGLNEILSQDIPDVLSKLKSEEVRAYVNSLSQGAKPETALREAFFAGRSLLSKYLGGESTPEVNLGPGFIDYILKVDGRIILIELKPLFEGDFQEGKIRSLKRLKQTELKWQIHKDQILKYIQKGSEFIILTDLKDWFFFNKTVSPSDFNYFFKTNLFDFIEDYNVIADLWDYLRRKDSQAIREGLDKRFFESLKIWVTKLLEVEFDTDEKAKVELTIRLLNKFIFIQTLDDFFVIDARWIKTNWDEIERKWHAKGKYQVLKEFFEEIDKWFYEYYDTELFRDGVLKYVKKDAANIDKLYNSLKLVLGLSAWQPTFSSFKGIMQYNFRHIDEDIFGKAYETFLAEVRHDEGIYYTPKYITEYIVENTVGKIYDKLLSDIEKAINAEDFDKAKKLVQQFVSIRVLDPACGSGSFLIKALRKIMEKYRKLNGIIEELDSKYNKYSGTLVRPKEVEYKVRRIAEVAGVVRAKNDRELISRLLIRHIHGNDLDSKALEVAKVNIWLEAIKLAPTEFRFDKLPMDTNHILPDLEMNLVNGNTVVGLPENLAVDFLHKNFGSEMHKLSELRRQYLENPTMPELVVQIEEIQRKIRDSLDEEFKRYLTEKELSTKIIEETKPMHWPLELWYLYFVNGKHLDENLRGADIVIGNPPYERIQVLKRKAPVLVDHLNSMYQTAFRNYDLSIIFVEKAVALLNKNGVFSYILPNKFMQQKYGRKLRNFIIEERILDIVVNFGDKQVFEDSTTYTCLLFLSKQSHKNFKYFESEDLANISEKGLKEQLELVQEAAIDSLSDDPWVFFGKEEITIMKKLSNLKTLEDVAENIFVGLQTSADKVYILDFVRDLPNGIELYSKQTGKNHILERGLVKPLISGIDVKRYEEPKKRQFIIFPYEVKGEQAKLLSLDRIKQDYPKTYQYLLQNKKVLEDRERGRMKGPEWYGYIYRKNLTRQEIKKICVPRLVQRIQAYYDQRGTFYLDNVDVGGVTLKEDSDDNYWYICALLNSAMLSFYLSKISTPFRGGFYSSNKQYLSKLPIKECKTKIEMKLKEKTVSLAKKIAEGKKFRELYFDIWKLNSKKLKNDDISLNALLIGDAEKTRSGSADETFTRNVSFYPNEKEKILSEEFSDFKISADPQKCLLEIIGITKDSEKPIYNVTLKDKLYLILLYCSLLDFLESRSKAKSLGQLLKKTSVPIIKPNPVDNTSNIVKKVEQDFREQLPEWLKDNNIILLDNLIEELDASIDATIFKLYKLNSIEINIVLQSLGILSLYQQLVLKHFEKSEN